MTEQTPKRTRRTPDQMAADGAKSRSTRTAEKGKRQEIRQRSRKPLKLDVAGIQAALEEEKGCQVKMKWCTHKSVPHGQQIGWAIVDSKMQGEINSYSPDGRVLSKSESGQDASGGALTVMVGNGEYNFLMWKDLDLYLAEDAVWNKEEADRPMDSLTNSAAAGERAGLGGDVEAYQPKQQTKISEQSEL